MATTGLSRAELIHSVVEAGTMLIGTAPLAERMQGLCKVAGHVLGCDHVSVMVIDGPDQYRGGFSYGHPPDIAAVFDQYTVSRDKPIIAEIEACDSYLLFNDAKNHPAMSRIARMVDVESVVIAPFTYSDGTPFGYLVADYITEKKFITVDEAVLATGMAHVAQIALLRDAESRLRRETSEAMLILEENERRRLSAELHDDPLQRLLALRLGLESFQASVDDATTKAEVAELIQQCRGTSASLRELMVRTHPTASELVDLESTLRTLVARTESATTLDFTFADHRTLVAPAEIAAALNRIAELATRNTLQHASAGHLVVELDDESSGTRLSVIDDGDGFCPASVDSGHLGLVSMRERAETLGGSFTLLSEPGNGTTVTAWLPHH